MKRRKRMDEKAYTKLFIRILGRRGWEFTPSSEEEDMFCHIDGRIHIYDRGRRIKTITVDLKGHKFTSHKSSTLCQYVEFMNVRGDRGWLFGEAEMIAILSEDQKKFYIIKRVDLIEYCEKLFSISLQCSLEEVEKNLLKLKCWVNHPSNACHKLYRRRNLRDIVTQITMEDVKRLSTMTI